MNILASYRYQMADHKNAILIFYLILIGLSLISGSIFVVSNTGNTADDVGYGGSEMVSLIFLFVVGLCTFKEIFFLFLQNGVSRKTLFAGKLLTIASIALIMSAVDTALFLLTKGAMALTGNEKYIFTFYDALYGANDVSGPVMLQVKSFFFEFFLALFVMAFGYFITILFYRLNNIGKILVGAGVPVFLLFGLPLLDSYLDIPVMSALFQVWTIATRTAARLTLSALLGFALFSALAWLLMRKAVLKK